LIQKHDNLQTGRPSLSLPDMTTRQGRRTRDKNKNNNNKIAASSSSSSSSLALPAELQEGRLHTNNSGADGGRERERKGGGGGKRGYRAVPARGPVLRRKRSFSWQANTYNFLFF
jgi:hypothetical protein